jgi:hypothetical protein
MSVCISLATQIKAYGLGVTKVPEVRDLARGL